MAITIINVNTPRNAVFNESRSVSVNYDVVENIDNISINNNTLDKFSFFERNSNKFVKLSFSYDLQTFNKLNVSQDQFNEKNKSYVDIENIEPFVEKIKTIKNYNSNLVVSNIGSLNSTSGNVLYSKVVNKAFVDKNNPVHSNNLLLENFDHPEFDYTFSFNYSNFYFRGGRIDAFSNVDKIKMSEDSVAKLKGFKENGLGKGKSAFKLNNVIKQYYRKEDTGFFAYNDNVDDVYLINDNFNKVISAIDYVYDANANKFTESTKTTFKPVHSSEARYFDFQESLKPPFRERTQKENYSWINSNIYKFTNTDINNKILSNKSKNDNIIEDIIYASHGRDINKEYNAGRDSIGFYESID